MKIEQDISSEFVLVLDEGDQPEGLQERREKAAYYKSVERKIVLKKKRANVSSASNLLLQTLRTERCCSDGIHTQTNGMLSTSRLRRSVKKRKKSEKKSSPRSRTRRTSTLVQMQTQTARLMIQ